MKRYEPGELITKDMTFDHIDSFMEYKKTYEKQRPGMIVGCEPLLGRLKKYNKPLYEYLVYELTGD